MSLARVAYQHAMLVVAQIVVEVAAAQEELLATSIRRISSSEISLASAAWDGAVCEGEVEGAGADSAGVTESAGWVGSASAGAAGEAGAACRAWSGKAVGHMALARGTGCRCGCDRRLLCVSSSESQRSQDCGQRCAKNEPAEARGDAENEKKRKRKIMCGMGESLMATLASLHSRCAKKQSPGRVTCE